MSIQLFQYQQHQVRVARIDENGAPWFVAKDVCDVLGLTEVSKIIENLDEDEKGTSTVRTPGGPQEMSTVSEAGLYSLILRSRKPEAKGFKRWLTHEVLPAIRKTGRYSLIQPATELDAIEANAHLLVKACGEMREIKKIAIEALRRSDAQDQKIEDITKATGELIARQRAAIALIPLLPVPSETVLPRGTRDNVVELCRSASVQTGKDHREIFSKVYRELKYRAKVDVVQRARNLRSQPGRSKTTVLDVVEALNLMDRLYAICVDLYGRPTNPVPTTPTDDLDLI